MRTSNGAVPVTGRTSRLVLGIAVAGGAAAFVLAGGGTAMASQLPGHGAARQRTVRAEPSHQRAWHARCG